MTDPDIAKQFDEHLRSPRQVWLLGAGVSANAGIPLMYPLTDRVSALLEDSSELNREQALETLKFVRSELPDNCHIEHILSHLGDMIALADRAKDKCFQVGTKRVAKIELQAVHHQILGHIRDVLRWGHRPAKKISESETIAEKNGTAEDPIVTVHDHRKFINALFQVGRAGVEVFREPIHFVTTNYDTLIEDALSLERLTYSDGFTGGAIAFWSEDVFKRAQSNNGLNAKLTKLHGSIDWYRSGGPQEAVYRVRHDELYPIRASDSGNVVIYPQSTKYTASREDPFGCLFENFRDLLSPARKQVLLVCGYSFGDDHINDDIVRLVGRPESGTTLLAFLKEGKAGIPEALNRLRAGTAGQRIFIATEKGLYRGSSGANFSLVTGEHDWWTFQGVTKLLEDGGLPADLIEGSE